MATLQRTLSKRPKLVRQKSWAWIDKGALWDKYDVEVEESPRKEGPASWWRDIRHDINVLLQMIHKRPMVLILPVCVFVLLLSLGIWGTVAAADKQITDRKKDAWSAAQNTASKFGSLLQEASFPALAVGVIVRTYPEYHHIDLFFPKFASDVLANGVMTSVVQRLDLAPFGQVSHVYPVYDVGYGVGYNFFQSPLYNRSIMHAATRGNLTLLGPTHMDKGATIALVAYPIYITNVTSDEQFGIQSPEPVSCSVCYANATRSKLWGMSIAVIDWTQLLDNSGFGKLQLSGYSFTLRQRPFMNGELQPIAARTPALPVHPLVLEVDSPGGAWSLAISPHHGWVPSWRAPLLAAVVLVSILAAILLFGIIVAMHKYKRLLGAILPPQVLKKLRRSRNFVQKYSNVTILFSDIVSYTSMAAEMDPVNVVQLLDEVYSMYDHLVEKHSVFKVDVIGDAFMAMAGCPDAEDPVKAAVKVARFAESMVQCTRGLLTKSGIRIRIRIGIHSGPAVAAVLGTKSPRFSVFGDTVNVASRMESTSAPMRIQLSAETAELLSRSGEAFNLTPRGEVAIKGKGYMHTFWLDSLGWEPGSATSLLTPAPTLPALLPSMHDLSFLGGYPGGDDTRQGEDAGGNPCAADMLDLVGASVHLGGLCEPGILDGPSSSTGRPQRPLPRLDPGGGAAAQLHPPEWDDAGGVAPWGPVPQSPTLWEPITGTIASGRSAVESPFQWAATASPFGAASSQQTAPWGIPKQGRAEAAVHTPGSWGGTPGASPGDPIAATAGYSGSPFTALVAARAALSRWRPSGSGRAPLPAAAATTPLTAEGAASRIASTFGGSVDSEEVPRPAATELDALAAASRTGTAESTELVRPSRRIAETSATRLMLRPGQRGLPERRSLRLSIRKYLGAVRGLTKGSRRYPPEA